MFGINRLYNIFYNLYIKKPLQRVTNMNKQDEPTEAQPCKALTGL